MIKNPKYKANKKNGGTPPPLTDIRVELTPVGCGNCIECRKQKARNWQVRLLEDIKTNENGHFVTLTFSNESIKHIVKNHSIKIKIEENKTPKYDRWKRLPSRYNKTTKRMDHYISVDISDLKGYEKDNAIAAKAIRLFTERWRKEEKKAPRHWLVTELGHNGTENIHLHGIIWTNEYKKIKKHWQYGFVWDGYDKNGKRINYVTARTVNYIVKYIHKVDKRNKEYKSIVLASKGIGRNFLNSDQAKDIKNKKLTTYRTSTGHKMALPIYWKNKIFTDEEKETLWIKRIETGERYVRGEKMIIKTPADLTEFDKLVQWHRERNAMLGYGGHPNENRKDYESKRRDILNETRIRNASGGVKQKG